MDFIYYNSIKNSHLFKGANVFIAAFLTLINNSWVSFKYHLAPIDDDYSYSSCHSLNNSSFIEQQYKFYSTMQPANKNFRLFIVCFLKCVFF
jgi:hypothetical protein